MFYQCCKSREGDLRSCRHKVLKTEKSKCRTGKHSQSRKTPAVQQLSHRMQAAFFQTTLLCQQHPLKYTHWVLFPTVSACDSQTEGLG